MNQVIAKDLETIVKRIKKEAPALSGRTLLISGGAGFLGSYIIGTIHTLNKQFLKKPCRVLCIDNHITGSKNSFIHQLKDPSLKFIKADVARPLTVKSKVDYIIHAAGVASPFYFKKFPMETIEAAVLGVKNLLELSRKQKIKGFLFFSSSEIYGNPDPKFIPTPETYKGNVSSIGPRACYDESKRLAETICITYHQLYNVPIKIVRPFNVYGPGMKLTDYRVIPTFFAKALAGDSLPVHGGGRQTRTFCYVADAVVGFLKVLLKGRVGEIYNVGTNQPEMTMVELGEVISKLFDNSIKVQLIPYPKTYPQDEPARRCPDLTKINSQLGYKTIFNLEKGLKQTLDWYRSQ